jgi:hypothetical protein
MGGSLAPILGGLCLSGFSDSAGVSDTFAGVETILAFGA